MRAVHWTLKLVRVAAVLLLCTSAFVAAVRDRKFYKILDVDEKASEKDIKKAYKKAALKWHPDRNQDNKEKAEKKFQEIANAYEVLSDPEKRKAYDQFGEPGLQGGPGGPGSTGHGDAGFRFQGGDAFNMFKDFFGDGDPFAGMGGGGGGQRTFQMHFSSSGGGPGGAGFENMFSGGMGGGGFPGFPGGGGGGGRQQGRGQQQGAGYSNAANVATLTAATFPKAWSSSVHLIHFLERGAQSSAAIVEAVTGVAAAMKSSKIFKVGVVYCAKEGELCEGRTAAPLQVFVPWQDKLLQYRGKLATGDIKAFVLGKIPDRVAHLKSAAALDALLHACGAPAPPKGAAAQGGAAEPAKWNLCAVLITDRAESPPLLRSLALQYRGNVAFGRTTRSSKAVLDALAAPAKLKLGSPGASTLVTVCNGNLAQAQVFAGRLNADELNKLLQAHSGGKKCRSRVALDEAGLASLRVGQLKALLQDRGMQCKLCLDRSDYLQFIRDHLIEPDL